MKRGITGADVIVLESNYDEDMLLGGGISLASEDEG